MKIAIDLDGTLLDSTLRHAQVLRFALNNFSIKTIHFFDEEFLKYKANGFSTKAFCLNVLQLPERVAVAVSEFWIDNIEQENFLILDKLYSDSKNFLNALSNVAILYLVTARNNKTGFVGEINRLNIASFFQKMQVVAPFNASHEKRDFFLENHIDLVVGDSEVDLYAAEGANIASCILNRGFRSKRFWDSHNVHSFNNLSEILEYLQKN